MKVSVGCGSKALWSLWMGKDELQLSLGALLFLLTALVFPASWLSFWPCIMFTDRLHKGGLGDEKEFSGNPLKARTALRSGVGSTRGAAGSQGGGNPGSLCALFFAKL